VKRLALITLVVCGCHRTDPCTVPTPQKSSTLAIEMTADTVIEGRVVNTTGVAVKAASVSLTGTTRYGVTDDDGRFRIERFPAGALELRVRAIGYEPATRAVTIGDHQGLSVRATLEPTVMMLTDQCGFVTAARRKPWWKFW
jgi:hypothetical protein